VSALTGACIAMRRDVFLEAKGFDEVLQVTFSDTLLCLKVLIEGYRNVCVQSALFIHFESKTRGLDDTFEKINKFWNEAFYARSRYPKYFKNDPYYNPNLSLSEAYKLALPSRAIKPWLFFKRNDLKSANILLLNAIGTGREETNEIVECQAQYFVKLGCTVFQDGHRIDANHECKYEPLTANPVEMAKFAVQNNIQCIIVHGSPFYSCSRWLGLAIPMIAFDYGDSALELFIDERTRTDLIREKNFSLCVVDRIFTFSAAVKINSMHMHTELICSGQDHLDGLADAVTTLLNKQMDVVTSNL
jgi:hypothetical protein